jgi:hypothetical protein
VALNIGGCFVLSRHIVFAQAETRMIGLIKSALQKPKLTRSREKAMEAREADLVNLKPDAKAFLASYVCVEVATQYFLMENDIQGICEARDILYRASNMGDMVRGWADHIHRCMYGRENTYKATLNYLKVVTLTCENITGDK